MNTIASKPIQRFNNGDAFVKMSSHLFVVLEASKWAFKSYY